MGFFGSDNDDDVGSRWDAQIDLYDAFGDGLVSEEEYDRLSDKGVFSLPYPDDDDDDFDWD